MNKFLMTALAAAVPVAVAMAAPPVVDDSSGSPVASASAKQKATPPVKAGGLLNTGVTPQQGKRVAEQTNRQIRRGEIAPGPNDH